MKLVTVFFLIAGIVLNSLAIINLFRLKKRKLPQNILIIFWIFILGVIVYFYAILHDLKELAFITYFLERGIRFFIPPLILIYLNSIFRESSNLMKKYLLHFIPFLLFLSFYMIPQSLNLDLAYINFININFLKLVIVQDLYGIVYFALCLKLFYSVKRALKHNCSTINDNVFLWLKKFLISFTCVLVVDFLLTVSEVFFGYNVSWDSYITVFSMIVAIGYIGYYGLTQSTIFLPNFLVEKYIKSNTSKKELYLSEIQKEELKEKFSTSMFEKKLYLLSDLNLKMLSNEMKTTERQLSAFFNEVLNSNFYDSINFYRVEEVKMKLKTDDIKNHSIAGIGLSSGFSSKSSFYRVFKKRTGVSPLVFIKESHNSQ